MSVSAALKSLRVLISAILACAALLPAAASCSSSPSSDGGKTAAPDNTASDPVPSDASPEEAGAIEEEEPETTVTDQIREQVQGIDYGGASFRVAGYGGGDFFYFLIGPEMNELWYESMTGDVYVDAVYQRNAAAEDLLNIRIEPQFTHDGTSYSAVSTLIEKCVKSGDNSVDAGYGSLAYDITSASRGNIHNYYLIDSIDLSEPWFDQNIIRNYSLGGKKLYALTGAFGIYDDYSVPVVYYNQNLLRQYSLDDPAELVKEGTWTFDALMGMGNTVFSDLDGNGIMDDADQYAFLDNADILPHLMEATGNLQTKIDSDGIPYVNCLTPEYIETAETVYNTFIKSPAVRFNSGNPRTMFIEGHALFYYELLATMNAFREMEQDFSLLPLPKLNEQQEKYVNPVNSVWCTAFGIPVTVGGEDLDRVGTVINVLSALSVDTVTKGLYEQILGAKLLREENARVMLDYAIGNKQYCWSNGYGWSGTVASYIASYEKNGTFVMASRAQAAEKSIQKSIENFLSKFDDLP